MNTFTICRRSALKRCGLAGVAAAVGLSPKRLLAEPGTIYPLKRGPEVDRYQTAEQALLAKYQVTAKARYLTLKKPAMAAHVLEAGKGPPVVMIHGGNAAAAQFAPLIGAMQNEFHLFAPDRPGCGLSDKIDYEGVPFREHATDFVSSLFDTLELPEAAIVANSMGGYFALVFALANPKRVRKLVLLGESAASEPPGPNFTPPPPAPEQPSIEALKGMWAGRLNMNVGQVSNEMWDAELARAALPGAALGWNSMVKNFVQNHLGTYALRPEMKSLAADTLIIWGDHDHMGTAGPATGRAMAGIVPHGRCEVLENAGHLPWIDQPDRCAALTMEFLRS